MLRKISSELVAILIFLALMVLTGATIPAFLSNSAASAEAENAFFTGSHLLSRENLPGAVESLERAVELDPGNEKYRQMLAVAYNNLGLKLTRDGNFREALRALSNALNLASEDKDIRSNLIAAAFQAANAPDDKVTSSEKVECLRRVLEIQPDSPATKKALELY